MEVNIPSDMHRNSSALRDRRPQSLTSEPLQAKFESPRWFSGARRSALLLLAGGCYWSRQLLLQARICELASKRGSTPSRRTGC